MKKFFEEPTLEMTFFDAENVVTGSGGTNTVAYDEAAAKIKEATGIDNVQIVDLTF